MVSNVSSASNPFLVNQYIDANQQSEVVSTQYLTSEEKDTVELSSKKSNKKEYCCTDGNDDGKLSFKEATSCIFDGIVKNIKGRFSKENQGMIRKAMKEHPVLTTLMITGVAAASIGIMLSPVGPLVCTLLGAFGFAIATQQLIDSSSDVLDAIKVAKNAQSDKEAKEAFSDIGDNGVDVVESAVALYSSAKTLSASYEVIDKTLDIANNIDDAQQMIDQSKQIYDDVINIVENRDVVKEMSKKSIANRIVNGIFVNTYLLNKFEEKSAEKQAKNIA